MNAEQLRMSLGSPDHINSTHTSTSVSEQWVYGSTYVYLDDGLISSFQQTR